MTFVTTSIIFLFGLPESNDIDYLHYSDLEIGLKYISFIKKNG